MSEEATLPNLEETRLRTWRLHELRRLGFHSRRQREHLLDLMERNELELDYVRKLIEVRNVPVEAAWWIIS